MKRHYLFLFLLLLGVSCKKNNKKDDDSAKLYTVVFSTTGFTQSTEMVNSIQTAKTVAVSGADPVSGVDHIYYVVSKASGNKEFVKIIHQERGQTPDFGTITDNLPPGRYDIGFLASGDVLNLENNRSLQLALPAQENLYYVNMQVDVSGQLNREIVLPRIVSQIEIQLEDVVPNNVNSLHISFEGVDDGESGVLKTLDVPTGDADNLGLDIVRPITNAEKGQKLTLKYYVPFLSVNSNIKVNFEVKDAAGNTLIDYTVSNVGLTQAKRTILKGTLFDKVDGAEIVIHDTPWESNPIVEF
jgi:hypothetical protein